MRKWIYDGKVAPRYPTLEDPGESAEECPICFMSYQGVNTTKCCGKPLCTECYLQVYPPRTKVVCPFCNSSNFAVSYTGPLSAEEVERRQVEDQITIEAKIRAEREEIKQQEEDYAKRKSGTASAQHSLVNSIAPSPSSSVADRGARSASTSIDIPLATVEARRKMESELRSSQQSSMQQELGAFRSTPGLALSPMEQMYGTSYLHSGRRPRRPRTGRMSEGDAEGSERSFQDLLEAFGPGVTLDRLSSTSDIQHVEEAMFLEAMRLSLLDEQRRREKAGEEATRARAASSNTNNTSTNATQSSSANNTPGGIDSGVPRTPRLWREEEIGASNSVDADAQVDENQQLLLAIELSMRDLPQPPPAAAAAALGREICAEGKESEDEIWSRGASASAYTSLVDAIGERKCEDSRDISRRREEMSRQNDSGMAAEGKVSAEEIRSRSGSTGSACPLPRPYASSETPPVGFRNRNLEPVNTDLAQTGRTLLTTRAMSPEWHISSGTPSPSIAGSSENNLRPSTSNTSIPETSISVGRAALIEATGADDAAADPEVIHPQPE